MELGLWRNKNRNKKRPLYELFHLVQVIVTSEITGVDLSNIYFMCGE